jgi:hypothetical protein
MPIFTINQELLNKMSADEIIKLLHSFALSPSIYSRIVEFVWSKDEYHIFVETANTLLPFLRAYKLKGANNLDQVLFYFMIINLKHPHHPVYCLHIGSRPISN